MTGINNFLEKKEEKRGMDIDKVIEISWEQGQIDKLLFQIEKKLKKGKTEEEIAEDLEEDVLYIYLLVLKYFC